MARYDIESFIDDFLALLKPSMALSISAVNAEKGDELLSQIGDNDYYLGVDNPRCRAARQYIYYTMPKSAALQTVNRGAEYAKSYPVEFGVVFVNNNKGGDSDIINYRRMLRYQKAFEIALKDCFFKLRTYGSIDLENIIGNGELLGDGDTVYTSSFNLIFNLGG